MLNLGAFPLPVRRAQPIVPETEANFCMSEHSGEAPTF
jgi:hypothetical protein